VTPEHAVSPALSIDLHSNIPYYVQLIDLIKELIHSKAWRPGSRIPSELELCQSYGISRTVVRQALNDLRIQGLITSRRGKGAFVAEPKINEDLAQKLTGFYQDMVERGMTPRTQVLHQRVVPCPEKIAGHLQVAAGSPVIDICRLRSVEDSPIQLVTSFLRYDLCPELATVDLTNRSLYAYLEAECGLFIVRGRRLIEAVAANELEARLLQVERGAPLVKFESICYVEDGRPVEFFSAVHRGDRSRFEVELVRNPSLVGAVETISLPGR
jgi:GntR family transcriptional regulator